MPDRPITERLLPSLQWLRRYTPRQFRGDLVAGATVGIMLIPQAMAYAILAGLPPVYGLYASIVPLIAYALLGTSRHLAVGPVALVSLLVFSGLSGLAEPGSDRYIQLAIITALGAGLIQLAMGLMRMGFLINFLSRPVLSGFTSAAALIIAISQIPNLTGLEIPATAPVHEFLRQLFIQMADTHLPTLLTGVIAIAAIFWLRRRWPGFPGPLAVVAAGILVTALFQLNHYGLVIVGDIPGGLPAFELPTASSSEIRQLIPLMLIITIVSFVESVAVAQAIARRHDYRIDSNQELIALGLSKVAGSLFQSYPTTGGFSRSAVNDLAGGHTGMASIITALIIVLTLLILTPLFYYLPVAILAAIILLAIIGLFDLREMIHLWRTDRKDLSMLLVTFISTLTLGIQEGIAVGVTLSVVTVIYSSSKPHAAELGRLGDTSTYRNVDRYPEAVIDKSILIFRFDSPLYFASVEQFQAQLTELISQKGSDLELVILDASSIIEVDSTGVHTLREMIISLQTRRISLFISGAIGPVRDKLKTAGIFELAGRENFFFDIEDAIAAWHDDEQRLEGYSPLQSNR